MNDVLDEQQKELLRLFGGRVKFNEPLSKHSSLRIGGPALAWISVETEDELSNVLRMARDFELDWLINGLGSNTLFPDEGFDGLVLRLTGEFARWHVDDGVAYVGAGVVNAHLVRGLLKEGWVGMEFLTLIPGTFGGAIVMNAGTREKELSEILEEVRVLSLEEPRMATLTPENLDMRYRHAEIPAGRVVCSGAIRLTRGDVAAASANVKADKDRRNETQPYGLASAGSTFANPPGDAAGRLIDSLGLKGTKIGGARISELHANFFINESGATSEDFLRLMALARVRVREEFGIELRPEVRFVGFDGWARLEELEKEVSKC